MDKSSLSLNDTGRIYLDHNATTKPLSSVLERLPIWADQWGNPSSIHMSGRGPKNLIRDARTAMARLLDCHPLEIIFTSGGSESNNLVIKGFFEARLFEARPSEARAELTRNEYITTQVEHPSVKKSFEILQSRGATVHFLSVNREGRIDLAAYESLLSPRTALVSVMYANNETGSVFPIAQMAEMAHAVGAKFHTDAVQALGKLPVQLSKLKVDYATFASHKIYALKGSGVVFARKGERLVSQISGGRQERGRRAGTENVLSIAALGHVASLLAEENYLSSRAAIMCQLRDHFEQQILTRISGVQLTGAGVERLPNTSSLLIDGIDGESLLMNLDLEGVSVSTGAACSSGSPEPSPVLLAMGLSRFEAQRSLRVSLGWSTTRQEMNQFIDILQAVVERLRALRKPGESDV